VAKSGADTRRERLAAALRENLKRRKAQKRGPLERAENAADAPPATSGKGLSPPKSPR
jgi:hypothetical protein